MSILAAARNNDWETVERLFKGSASLLERDAEGKTLLHWAAIHGQVAFLERHRALLGEGLVNAPEKNGNTPLYLATRNGHWDCVKQLLLAKANLQALTPDGQSLLKYWVASLSDPALLESLLSTQKAKVRRECLSIQTNGLSLLHHAAAAGQTKVVQWLIDQSAAQEEKNEGQNHHALHVNTSDPHGYTPLHHAIKYGHVDTVTALIKHSARLDLLNINGDSPIHYAMRNGQLALAQKLTQHLFKQLGFHQRPEHDALLQAFSTLYAYHHRQTAEQFFKQAQEEHQADERKRLNELLQAKVEKAEGEERKEEGAAPIEPLPREVLEIRFQKSQLSQALEQFYVVLKELSLNDDLIPFVLWAISEVYLQKKHDSQAYEVSMSYAASAIVHYQKFVKVTSQHQASYEALVTSQENRVVITYRQEVLDQMSGLDAAEQKLLSKHRKLLTDHRQQLKQNMQAGKAIQALLKENTDFFKKITAGLWVSAFKLAKQVSPRDYRAANPRSSHHAIVGLGSMSKQEMCPYSDLEFALLLEKDDLQTRQFFQPIIRLMHLVVIALGEAPLTIPCQVSFSPTVKGYHFDEGGNTPLSKEFVGTPQFLAEQQRVEDDASIIRRNVLRTTTFIYGQEFLYENYRNQLNTVLSERLSYFFSFSRYFTRGQIQALEILRGALSEFSPSNLTNQRHIRGFNQLNIKTDLYRLPSQVIQNLCLYYGLSGNTTFEKIEALQKARKLDPENAQHLRQLMEVALSLRLKTHLHYGTEEESVGCQAEEHRAELAHEASLYVLTEQEREQLLNLYRILLPLELALKQFVDPQEKYNPFATNLLYSEAVLIKHPALQHHLAARRYELYSPEQALSSYRQALQLDPDNQEIYLHCVRYLSSLHEIPQRQQADYEATAYQYARQLPHFLLSQKLPSSNFDTYYQAVPLSWRPVFRKAFNETNPLHRRILIRLDAIDHLMREDPQKAHQDFEEAQAHFATTVQALPPLLAADIPAALKDSSQNDEVRCALLTHSLASLLPSLIASEAQKAQRYQDDIQKNLLAMASLLMNPKKGDLQIDSFVIYYRRLPFSIRLLFRHALLAQQENQQKKANQDFSPLLLKALNEEPDEAGQRESWQQHKRAWQANLSSLVESNAEEGSAYLVSPLLDSSGQKAVRLPLKAQVQKALLDEAGEFQHSVINGSQHHVVKLKIKQADGTPCELYCKAYPEMPGMTYLIERLHYRLIGHGTCVSELIKIERPGKPPIPVLISELVPGPTLHEVLKKDPKRLDHLNHQAYSGLVLLAILTNPEDGLPTNYIVTPWEEGANQLTLVSIDHDHALFPPYLLESVKVVSKEEAKQVEAEEAEEEKQSLKPKLQIKTILFCLDAMHKPIDPAAREQLLRLKPIKVLGSVLRESQVQNDYYEQLFDEETIKTFHEKQLEKQGVLSRWRGEVKSVESCTVPIPLKEGDAIKLYQKLHHLQQFLTEYPEATLLQCLLHIEPRVGMAYTLALYNYDNPPERLLRLGEYPVNLQGQMVTNTRALKSLRIQTQQIGAEHYADLKDLTPAQGLAELDLMTYQQDTLDSIRLEVMQGDLRRFLALKASEHKAAVISGTAVRREGIDWRKLDEVKQLALLEALKGIPFTHLNLSGCTVSTKQQLIDLLIQSPDCIVLEINGHPKLDDFWVLAIASNARHLKELTIRQAPNLEHIRNTATFRHLNTLDIAHNPALRVVDIKAPQLKYLQAKHCSKLSKLKTGSQQLREIDATHNAALQLTKLIGHTDSAYTVKTFKLSGCSNVENREILSAYPFLLWSSFSEKAQAKTVLLLDQYLGRSGGWSSLSEEQRKQIILRSVLCESEYGEEHPLMTILEYIGGEKVRVFIQIFAQQTLVALAGNLRFSDEQIAHIFAVVLSNLEVCSCDEVTLNNRAFWMRVDTSILSGLYMDARKVAQEVLTALSQHAHLSDKQIAQIFVAARSSLKDKRYEVRQAAKETLAAISKHLHLSDQQITQIVTELGSELKDRESDVQQAAKEVLAALIEHSHLSDQQVDQMFLAACVDLKDKDNHVRRGAQRMLVVLSQHSRFCDQQITQILAETRFTLEDEEEVVRFRTQQMLSALSQHSNLSEEQITQILAATVSSLKDKVKDVRQEAHKTLTALSQHSRLSDKHIAQILAAARAGLKDKEGLVRQAAEEVLVVLIRYPRFSDQQIDQMLAVTYSDLKYRSFRQNAQRALVLLSRHPNLPEEQVGQIIADNDRSVRLAAHQMLAVLSQYPHLSGEQIAQIFAAVVPELKHVDSDIQKVAREVIAALSKHTGLSDQQFAQIFAAALTDYKASINQHSGYAGQLPSQILFTAFSDQSGFIRYEALQMLVAVSQNPRISNQQIEQILTAVFSGLKNVSGFSEDIHRSAAYEALAALSQHPRISDQQLAQILTTAFSGLKEIRNQTTNRAGALKILSAVSQQPCLSDQQFAQILAAVLPGLDDKDKYIQRETQRALINISQHLRAVDQQIVQVFAATASNLKDINIQETPRYCLIQQAKRCPVDQLPAYLRWINALMRDADTYTQLTAVSMLSIFYQRCGGSLEPYLSILQAERQIFSGTHPPDWFKGGIYEQLEPHVIDFYVPPTLQQHVKIYDKQAQTAASALEMCKAEMEVIATPDDVKIDQQQFLAHQAMLFKQYHTRAQQRVAEFQRILGEKSGAFNQETIVKVQAQFAKEQEEAKAIFRTQVDDFYQKTSTELEHPSKNAGQMMISIGYKMLKKMHAEFLREEYEPDNEPKKDVSELLTTRRKFLDLRLEQLETLATQQQTVFTEWYRALQIQQQTDVVAGPQPSLGTQPLKKQLVYENAQIARLQQEILQAQTSQMTIHIAGANISAGGNVHIGHIVQVNQQSEEERQAVKIAAEKQVAEQTEKVGSVKAEVEQQSKNQEAIAVIVIKQTEEIDRLKTILAVREKNREQTRQSIDAIAAIEQVPVLQVFYHCVQGKLGECLLAAQALNYGVTIPTISIADALLPIPYTALAHAHRHEQSTHLVGSLVEMQQLAEKIAHLLTWRYETQLKKLTHESAALLGEVAVARMMLGLHSEQALNSDKLLLDKIMQAMYHAPETLSLTQLMQQTLTTISGDSTWTASSVLLKPGIALWDREKLTLSFHVQEDKTQNVATEAEKYGYRLGSLQEVMALSLSMTDHVEKETRVGLCFIKDTQKLKSVTTTIRLRKPPQAAENLKEVLEQKDEEAAATVNVVSIKQSAELQKKSKRSTKHVRFLDEIVIIPSKPSLATAAKKRGIFVQNQSGALNEKLNASQAAATPPLLYRKLMDALEKWDLEEAIKRSLNGEQMQRSVKRMQTRAKYFGYRCIDVKRDGRCFYHAFILQLKRINSVLYQNLTVQMCLEKITQHIIENQDLYEQFIHQAHGMSLDNFLDTVLKNDGTFWADNILISAAARTFNVDLVIVHNDGKKPSVSRRSNPEGLLYLAHEVEQHYQALEEDPTLAPQEVLDAYRIGAAIDELERQGERGLRR